METVYLHDWKFNMDKELENIRMDPWSPGFDDTCWEDIVVPHDWSVTKPFSTEWSSGTGYLPGGTGWYRTVFQVPQNRTGAAFICFDGVYKNSQVWCNGYYLGRRPSGYASFRYDISHCLKEGDNTIAVKVTHEDFADSRWFTGSGIYRKACICFCDRVYVDDRTVTVHSEYQDNKAEVTISGKITGGKAGENITITACIDGTGKGKTTVQMHDTKDSAFEIKLTIPNPTLWSPETPHLYRLHLELQAGADIFQTQPMRIGIRTIAFDPDKGFFLNGIPRKIKGVCLHHDAGCLGSAVWPDVWRRRLEKLKDMGCNAIRMSHNPHMDELYDLCDEMGFMVMDEAFDEWEGCKNKWSRGHNVYPPVHQGYAMDFPEWHVQDLEDMVIRNRNRPSVILWSIGNEIDYPNDPYVHPLFTTMSGNNDANKPAQEMMYNPDKPNMERLATIGSMLVNIVKNLDTSRPVLIAAAFPELSSQVGLFDSLDIVGYNYKEHLYEEDHKRFPRLPITGSENRHDMPAWKAVLNNEFISGQFLWTGIDYLGEARGWPVRGSSPGLLDTAGYEKTAFYRRKALWTDRPFMYLASRLQPEQPEKGEIHPSALLRSWDYMPGQIIEVICYTNMAQAELFCNGTSCGKGRLDDNRGYISWTIPFERGTLEASSVGEHTETRDAIESTLAPVRLHLHEWKSTAVPSQEKYRIIQIEACILDEAGRFCTGACHNVTVSLEGEGKILGIENGDLSDCTRYSSQRRQLYKGRLVVYVLRASHKPATLTAAAEGLRSAVISLQ